MIDTLYQSHHVNFYNQVTNVRMYVNYPQMWRNNSGTFVNLPKIWKLERGRAGRVYLFWLLLIFEGQEWMGLGWGQDSEEDPSFCLLILVLLFKCQAYSVPLLIKFTISHRIQILVMWGQPNEITYYFFPRLPIFTTSLTQAVYEMQALYSYHWQTELLII